MCGRAATTPAVRHVSARSCYALQFGSNRACQPEAATPCKPEATAPASPKPTRHGSARSCCALPVRSDSTPCRRSRFSRRDRWRRHAAITARRSTGTRRALAYARKPRQPPAIPAARRSPSLTGEGHEQDPRTPPPGIRRQAPHPRRRCRAHPHRTRFHGRIAGSRRCPVGRADPARRAVVQRDQRRAVLASARP